MSNFSLFLTLSIATIGFTGSLNAQAANPEEKGPSAKAGFQLRIDSVSSTIEETNKDKEISHAFELNTAKIVVGGELTSNTSYLVRLDVKKAGFSEAGVDKGISALDRAYIATKVCENFIFKIGRMPINALSIEADYSSMDQYIYSYLNGVVANIALPVTAGIEGNYLVFGQTLGVQVFNGYQDKASSSPGKQKSDDKNVAAYYRGRLFDGMLKPIITYSSFTRIKGGDDSNDGNVVSNAVGVGTQISAFNADFDIEYDMFNSPNYRYVKISEETKALTTDVKSEQKVSSVVAQVAYNLTAYRLRPFLKLTSEKEELDGEDSLTASRYAAGIEWNAGLKGFRYHLVYVGSKDERKDAATNKTNTKEQTQLLAGVAAKI